MLIKLLVFQRIIMNLQITSNIISIELRIILSEILDYIDIQITVSMIKN